MSTNDARATANFNDPHDPATTAYDSKNHADIIETRSANKPPGAGDHILPIDDEGQQFSPRVKKQLLLACLFALLVGNMMLLNVASFLPSFIQYNDWSNPEEPLNSTDSSLIIAVFSVAQLIFAPFNSVIKNFIGSKNTILIGFALMTITTFGLGWISLIKNSQAFKYSAVFIRFFQG